MKEHAVSYTYDRMKLIYPIVLIACACINFLLYSIKKKWVQYVCCVATLMTGTLNFNSYAHDITYIWPTDYRQDNMKLAEVLLPYRDNAVFGYGGAVRGYLNMTFHTGCYEDPDIARIQQLSLEKGKQYAIVLSSPGGAWNMYDFTGATIYDNSTQEFTIIVKNNHEFMKSVGKGYPTSSMTDNNWENGISRTSNVVLFSRNDRMLEKLSTAMKMTTENAEANILSYESDDLWIRVTVDGDPKVFAYPAFVDVE